MTTRRAHIHLDGDRSELSLVRRRSGGRRPERSVGVWEVQDRSGPAGALRRALASAPQLGHGRRIDLVLRLETDRVLWEVVADPPADGRQVGLTPDEVSIIDLPSDLGVRRGTATAVTRCRPDTRLRIIVGRAVIDELEAAVRQRRCAGRVRLELALLERLRRLLEEEDLGDQPVLILDVRRCVASAILIVDRRLAACRTVAVGTEPADAVLALLEAVLRDPDVSRSAWPNEPRLELWGRPIGPIAEQACEALIRGERAVDEA